MWRNIIVQNVGNHFREESNVTVNMNLNFDSENTGSVGLMEQFAGPIDPSVPIVKKLFFEYAEPILLSHCCFFRYFNGTHKVEFVTDYFEVRNHHY